MKIKDPTCPNKDPAQPNKWTNIFLKDCTLEYSLVKYSLWTKFCLLFESESESGSVVSNSLWPCGLYSPWNSPGQNTGVDNCSLFQGIFSTQGLNPGLPHCRWILYQLSHQGSPKILNWVAYSFSRGSSRPRNGTRVSCIAGGFFTCWATQEVSFYSFYSF